MLGLFQKKPHRGLEIIFWKAPEIFRLFVYPWKFQTKQGFTRRNFSKLLVLHHSSEIVRPKTKTPGNSTWYFLDYTWKFHIVFNWPPRKFTCSNFFITPGNSISLTTSLFEFFWNNSGSQTQGTNLETQWNKWVGYLCEYN